MNMQKHNDTSRKYVFICGLQRSGTSVLARNIGRLENCASFKNTGVLHDEGQYLQDVYPSDHKLGGAGWYGFNPRAHLTEDSELLTPENVARLRNSWHSHWDKDKSICLEKTPGNLIMTRFLQAAFPNSYFIVIRRHPVAVSMASSKWSMSSLHRLFEHWLRCYEWFEEDKKYLNHVYELTYEEYIANPTKHHDEIAGFIGTNAPSAVMEPVTSAHNRKYLERWSNLLSNSPFRTYYRYIGHLFEQKFARYNYSLLYWNGTRHFSARQVPSVVGAAYCSLADAAAFIWRLHGRKMEVITKPLRSSLPTTFRDRVKEALQKKSLHWLARLVAPMWFNHVRKRVR
jgi:hypothetical protein